MHNVVEKRILKVIQNDKMTKQQQKKQGIQIQTYAIFQACAMKMNNHVRLTQLA